VCALFSFTEIEKENYIINLILYVRIGAERKINLYKVVIKFASVWQNFKTL
jgi:hypothetical protein